MWRDCMFVKRLLITFRAELFKLKMINFKIFRKWGKRSAFQHTVMSGKLPFILNNSFFTWKLLFLSPLIWPFADIACCCEDVITCLVTRKSKKGWWQCPQECGSYHWDLCLKQNSDTCTVCLLCMNVRIPDVSGHVQKMVYSSKKNLNINSIVGFKC